MTTPVHNVDQCAGCGQYDDHPKVHVGDVFGGTNTVKSLHFDCLPYDLAQSLRANGHGPAFDAAKNGTHGDELRAFQATTVADQNPEA